MSCSVACTSMKYQLLTAISPAAEVPMMVPPRDTWIAPPVMMLTTRWTVPVLSLWI